jgi:hypothetical protein
MKKLILSLSFLLFTLVAMAQAPMTADQKAEETVSKLKKDIALTDEQVPKVKAITVDRVVKVTAAVKKNGADKQKLQYANKQIMEEWETKLKGIVSEEQYSKYLASKGQ